MKLISKTRKIRLLKKLGIGIIAIVLISSFSLQSSYGHDPGFEVRTAKDILKFCEFYFEEYELLGIDDLSQQHPNFPNLRACVILYNHVAWNSTHQARELVLIAEIEKYLGDSSYIKERHLEYSTVIPNWIKKEAQLWSYGQISNTDFAYGIRTMIEAGIIFSENRDRDCNPNNLCFEEKDFVKYSHIDKFKNAITIKHEVYSMDKDEIILKIDEVSKEGKITKQMNLNNQGLIESEKCCNFYDFLIPTPLVLGDIISNEMEILSDTTYEISKQDRPSWIARDSTGQNVKIIDKETGLVFSYENHETEVLSVGNYITITDTNFFDTKIGNEAFEAEIPEWWKYTTRWLVEEKISESEYLDGLEALISKKLLKV
jgi:hypothetical protein